MGYMRIVQFGNVTEVYEYENDIVHNRERFVSELTKKRQKQARLRAKQFGYYQRSKRSIIRSKQAFYRLCHHNNCLAKSIHFVTLTFAYDLTLKTASRHVARFMEKLKKNCEPVPISYISVPELTKKGRYHFHLLIYNLPTKIAGSPIYVRQYNRKKKVFEFVSTTTERFTRNLQRQFQRGYLDISPTEYNSPGIAGYMAKYMGKALGHSKSQAERGYTCSRNIEKITSSGGNTLNGYAHMIIPTTDIDDKEERTYDVKYLGKCRYTKIIKKL